MLYQSLVFYLYVNYREIILGKSEVTPWTDPTIWTKCAKTNKKQTESSHLKLEQWALIGQPFHSKCAHLAENPR